jgi:hypothetical protein
MISSSFPKIFDTWSRKCEFFAIPIIMDENSRNGNYNVENERNRTRFFCIYENKLQNTEEWH